MNFEQITSVKNGRVKDWAALKQKKYRNQQGLYIAEGTRLVEDAVASGAPIEAVLLSGDLQSGRYDKIINGLASLGTAVYEVTESVMEHISDTKTPQGVIAVIKQTAGDAEGYLANKNNPLYLVLDGIQDPGNLGTMIRTADAVGATGVFLGKTCVDLYNPKVVRSTMGSMYHLPIFEVDLELFLPAMQRQGVAVVGTAVDAKKTVYQHDFTQGTALVIGSEAHGLSAAVTALVDHNITLPMPGQAESLNAAIASSVMLYEALRQRSH
ncbi:TrmH family RNA methyltransferase [Tumebacillus sp. BK434]|uniref:TrmH family RNA methyltransferase n=1 Tax=Tumebacillus sp. BK434 TaxID=2512169 RepID=UPI001051A4C3|nr:RNA methyltransferase [Tumebacillus sp. BK434]TCP53680.1 TrmH family RNA methyltransferase [Tumebacillus sp. BK434]